MSDTHVGDDHNQRGDDAATTASAPRGGGWRPPTGPPSAEQLEALRPLAAVVNGVHGVFTAASTVVGGLWALGVDATGVAKELAANTGRAASLSAGWAANATSASFAAVRASVAGLPASSSEWLSAAAVEILPWPLRALCTVLRAVGEWLGISALVASFARALLCAVAFAVAAWQVAAAARFALEWGGHVQGWSPRRPAPPYIVVLGVFLVRSASPLLSAIRRPARRPPCLRGPLDPVRLPLRLLLARRCAAPRCAPISRRPPLVGTGTTGSALERPCGRRRPFIRRRRFYTDNPRTGGQHHHYSQAARETGRIRRASCHPLTQRLGSDTSSLRRRSRSAQGRAPATGRVNCSHRSSHTWPLPRFCRRPLHSRDSLQVRAREPTVTRRARR
jgi:hypothetical protein